MEKARELKKKKNYFYFIDYAKDFDFVDHSKLHKIMKDMGVSEHLTASWEICIQVKKQQLQLDMEHQTRSKLGKE